MSDSLCKRCFDPTGTDDAAAAWARISADWSQVLPELLLAPSDDEFDAIWESFIARRDEMGYDLVKEYRQKVYDDRLAKMQ